MERCLTEASRSENNSESKVGSESPVQAANKGNGLMCNGYVDTESKLSVDVSRTQLNGISIKSALCDSTHEDKPTQAVCKLPNEDVDQKHQGDKTHSTQDSETSQEKSTDVKVGDADSANSATEVLSSGETKPEESTDSPRPSRSSERAKMRKMNQERKDADPGPPPKVEVVPKQKAPLVDLPIEWKEGDLVWSLVSGHPLWPCMVTADPVLGSHSKMKGSGSITFRAYHVQFFGDSPEHAWINGPRVYEFTGKDNYEKLVHEIAKGIHKRPPKVGISKRFIENWNAAIEEIAMALPMTAAQRMEKFTFIYVKNIPHKKSEEEEKAEKESTSESGHHTVVQLKPTDRKDNFKSQKVTQKQRQQKDAMQAPKSDKGEEAKSLKKVGNSSKNKESQRRSVSPSKKLLEKDKKRKSKTEKDAKGISTPYKCMHCPDVYFSVEEMREHCKLNHAGQEATKKDKHLPPSSTNTTLSSPNASGDDTRVKCHVCGDLFPNKRSLGQHRRFSHPGSVCTSDEICVTVSNTRTAPPVSTLSADAVEVSIPNGNASPLPKNTLGSVNRAKPRQQVCSQARKEPICSICEKNGDVLQCTKDCLRSFHVACLDYKVSDPFVCKGCETDNHACIICSKYGADWLGKMKRCVVPLCGRFFHESCLQIYTLRGLPDGAEKLFGTSNNTRCPSHTCASCMSKTLVEAQKNGGTLSKPKFNQKSRLLKCIRCPTAYHASDDCLAAGSVILGGQHIICPGHFNPIKSLPHHNPVHISWCFVCSKGGELICCATCPAAFHAKCIDLEKTPEGDWHCLDCSCGIRPLYDDIIWVKLGTYRWWPGQVTHPAEVPDNISRLQHGPGEFVVRFFGSNDYFWLSKYRVFLYQEGDNGATNRHCSRGISGVFRKALQEAEEKFAEVSARKQQQEEVKSAENDKKPAPYKHIKCNKPVGRVQIYAPNLTEMAKCVCKRNDPHPCGQESECLNRMLMYECHPSVCPAGDRCENQRFQKCDYPPTEIFKTSWGGWGLKTKVFIKKGSFVNEYVGELVDEEECRLRIERSHEHNVTNFYMLTIDKDRIIDAGPKGNFSRFMNHCCSPNCETQKWMVNGDTRVGLFAVRDIMPDEELTFNYNLDCLGNDKTKCMCGSNNCSGFIGVRPKPQTGAVKKDMKKKRKVRRSEPIPQHDDFCFRCRQTGTLVCCDYKGCLRAFCLDCLHIQKPPYGKWECPCHHCDWCGRRAQYFCSFCPNSFCGSHVQNQLHPSVPNGFDTCLDHRPETAEFEMAETVATVNELMNASMQEDESTAGLQNNLKTTSVITSQEKPRARSKSSEGRAGVNSSSGDEKHSIGQKRKRESIVSKSDKKSRKVENF